MNCKECVNFNRIKSTHFQCDANQVIDLENNQIELICDSFDKFNCNHECTNDCYFYRNNVGCLRGE